MKRRICVALALMIALMLSVCAIADEYETVTPAQDVEEETPVISAGSVDDKVGEAEDADLDDLLKQKPADGSTEEKKTPEQPVIEEESSEEEKPEGEPAEDPTEEEPTEEEPVQEDPTEEEPTEEEPVQEEPTEEEAADKGSLPEGAGSPEGETEGVASDEEPTEQPAEEETAEEEASEAVVEAEPVEELPEAEAPVANELTYNGEAQALVSAQGAWLYSLDGESYGEDIPTAIDAGEYTVYFKAEADAEPETLTVKVAKADVTFTPPVAAFIEE